MDQQLDIHQLRQFHSLHFPGQTVPELSCQPEHTIATTDATLTQADDDLGYYDDGTKRTLTDEQLKMFRHSEIQRLLSERKAARDKEEKMKRKLRRAKDSASVDTRKLRHYDAPEPGQVDTLMYEERPQTESESQPPEPKFLWPILGAS
jgi:hypothetical protein